MYPLRVRMYACTDVIISLLTKSYRRLQSLNHPIFEVPLITADVTSPVLEEKINRTLISYVRPYIRTSSVYACTHVRTL